MFVTDIQVILILINLSRTPLSSVELNQLRDKLPSAEKVRREKWVEAKQKEIKALTVKGLEPEIARLIARHKQELRNLKGKFFVGTKITFSYYLRT